MEHGSSCLHKTTSVRLFWTNNSAKFIHFSQVFVGFPGPELEYSETKVTNDEDGYHIYGSLIYLLWYIIWLESNLRKMKRSRIIEGFLSIEIIKRANNETS